MGMRLRFLILPIVVLSILGLTFRPVDAAQRFYSEDQVSITKDQVINDDVFISADDVNVQGTINGDLYAAGGNVQVDATVNGNMYAAGGTLTLSGQVKGTVLLTGGTVNINNANIGGSLLLGAGSVNIDDKSKIEGSVLFGAGMINIRAMITRNVVGGAGSVTVDNTVGKDLLLGVGDLSLGSNAKITGDVTYLADKEARIDAETKITGKTERVIRPQIETHKIAGWQRDAQVGYLVWSYLSVLIVGALFLYLFRPQLYRVSEIMEKRPVATMLTGFLMMLLAIPLIIVVGLTILGIQLVFVSGMVYALAIYLSKIFFAFVVGRVLTKALNLKGVNEYLIFAFGLLVYYLAQLVPFLGNLVAFVGFIYGTGAILMAIFHLIQHNHRTVNAPSPTTEPLL